MKIVRRPYYAFYPLQVNNLPDYMTLLRTLKSAVLECDAPDIETLQGGLDILKHADLRPALSERKRAGFRDIRHPGYLGTRQRRAKHAGTGARNNA